MIAKLIVWDRDRTGRRAPVCVRRWRSTRSPGVQTNLGLLRARRRLHPAFLAAEFDTGFLGAPSGAFPQPPTAEPPTPGCSRPRPPPRGTRGTARLAAGAAAIRIPLWAARRPGA